MRVSPRVTIYVYYVCCVKVAALPALLLSALRALVPVPGLSATCAISAYLLTVTLASCGVGASGRRRSSAVFPFPWYWVSRVSAIVLLGSFYHKGWSGVGAAAYSTFLPSMIKFAQACALCAGGLSKGRWVGVFCVRGAFW